MILALFGVIRRFGPLGLAEGEMKSPHAAHRASGDSGPAWILLPRDHGAWGMLLAPFVAAAILGGAWTLELLAGLAAISFLLLDPGLRHAVEAETESAFLLTLGGPGED